MKLVPKWLKFSDLQNCIVVDKLKLVVSLVSGDVNFRMTFK